MTVVFLLVTSYFICPKKSTRPIIDLDKKHGQILNNKKNVKRPFKLEV